MISIFAFVKAMTPKREEFNAEDLMNEMENPIRAIPTEKELREIDEKMFNGNVPLSIKPQNFSSDNGNGFSNIPINDKYSNMVKESERAAEFYAVQ